MATDFVARVLAKKALQLAGNTTSGGQNLTTGTTGLAVLAAGSEPEAQDSLGLGRTKLLLPAADYVSWGFSGDGGAQARLLLSTMDTFGGPGVWDPVAKMYRSWSHRQSGNKIYQWLSTDGSNWTSPNLALDLGTAGTYDDTSIGVPFVWRESGTARPWRMIYRGSGTGGTNPTKLGLCIATAAETAADGTITWERKFPDGTDVADKSITTTTGIDFGNVFFADGLYWLYWNYISTNDRTIFLSTSPDLKTWTSYGAPDKIWEGRATAEDAWDYDDTYHTSAATNTAYGYFCGFYGRSDKADGSVQYLALVVSYEQKSGTSGTLAGITAWTSPSPLFTKANRTFRGWVIKSSNATRRQGLEAMNASGFDVPRLQCEDVRQIVPSSPRIWVSTCLAQSNWQQTELLRTAGCEWASGDNANLGWTADGGIAYDLPSSNPAVRLAPRGLAGEKVLYLPGKYGTLRDFSGNGVHLALPNAGAGITRGAGLVITAVTSCAGVLPSEHITALDWTDTLCVEFDATKSAILGAAAAGCLFCNNTGGYNIRSYINGNAGDTAVTLRFQITDSTSTVRSFTSASWDWSAGAKTRFAVCLTGGKIYFFRDGTLINAGGSAFAYTSKVHTAVFTFAVGGELDHGTVWKNCLIGTFDQIRMRLAGDLTANYTPAAFDYGYATTGTIFSRVYDFGQSCQGKLDLDCVVPATCGLTVLHRVASSATDKSQTAGDFSTTLNTAGRYHQWLIAMTGDGTTTPTIKNVKATGIA